MGLKNYLQYRDGNDDVTSIQFRYGFVWEREYAIGDKVLWDPAQKPSDCPDDLEVGGIAASTHDDIGLVPKYYAIKIVNDAIMSVRLIEEVEYDALYDKDTNRMVGLQGVVPSDE